MTMNVEWVILADGAQVVGNKLYVLGGGWDVLTVHRELPVTQPVSLAVSFLVPWDQTNRKHNFELEVQHDDGNTLAKVGGQFEVGRPAGLPPGSTQRSQMALTVPLRIDKPGVHAIITRIEGEEKNRSSFRVLSVNASALPKS